ncbi:hypothetical protein AB0N06_23280 [Streptomyces sp. NPDC051020]
MKLEVVVLPVADVDRVSGPFPDETGAAVPAFPTISEVWLRLLETRSNS